MKKFTAILIISVLAFNCVGYRFVSAVMEHSSDLALEANINHAQYNESDLVEVRVPLNAPYLMNRSASFERCDGEVRIGDNDYRYVMRKVENGELVLLCLRNDEKNRIRNSRADFFKLVNDLNNTPQGKDKQSSTSLNSFTTVYRQENNSWALKPLDEHLELYHSTSERSAQLAGYSDLPMQPPRG